MRKSEEEIERTTLNDVMWKWLRQPYEDGGFDITPLNYRKYQLKRNLAGKYQHLFEDEKTEGYLQHLIGLLQVDKEMRHDLKALKRTFADEFFELVKSMDEDELLQIGLDLKDQRTIINSRSKVWMMLASKGLNSINYYLNNHCCIS